MNETQQQILTRLRRLHASVAEAGVGLNIKTMAAEIESIGDQMQQSLAEEAAPIFCSPINGDEVWLRAWCAVAGTEDVTEPEVCSYWADGCLADFDNRFNKKEGRV